MIDFDCFFKVVRWILQRLIPVVIYGSVDHDTVVCCTVDGLESFQLYFVNSRDSSSVPDLFVPHICA